MKCLRLLNTTTIFLIGTIAGCATAQKQATVESAPKTPQPASAPAATRAVDRWESAIARFEAADRANPPATGGVLFIGSSSIVGWRTLKSDFPDANVLNRGFGGSRIGDVNRYVERMVFPYAPRTIVFYCGENDIAAERAPSTPQDVLTDFRRFVGAVHAKLPQTRIVFLSLKPSPSRMKFIETFRETNRLIEAYARSDGRLAFVNVHTPLLGPDGQPRAELFRSDRLHLLPEGYAIWVPLVRPHVNGTR